MDNCSLCSETIDSDELIEVKDSLIKLKTGIADFSTIISDVFGCSVNTYLCSCW